MGNGTQKPISPVFQRPPCHTPGFHSDWGMRFLCHVPGFSPWIEDKSERHDYAMALCQVLLDEYDGLEDYWTDLTRAHLLNELRDYYFMKPPEIWCNRDRW